jgi:phosphohistidine swiveling domain-containing protein
MSKRTKSAAIISEQDLAEDEPLTPLAAVTASAASTPIVVELDDDMGETLESLPAEATDTDTMVQFH